MQSRERFLQTSKEGLEKRGGRDAALFGKGALLFRNEWVRKNILKASCAKLDIGYPMVISSRKADTIIVQGQRAFLQVNSSYKNKQLGSRKAHVLFRFLITRLSQSNSIVMRLAKHNIDA